MWKVFIKMGRVVVVTFEENIDTSAGASVDWGKQGETDSYANSVCGIDGTQKKWNKWSEIQWCRLHSQDVESRVSVGKEAKQ